MYEVRIPKLGLDTLDCEIRCWLVSVGDSVEFGTPLLDVETEKATVTIQADVGGVLREVHAQAGDTVAVGKIVALIDDSGPRPHLGWGLGSLTSIGNSGGPTRGVF